MTTRTYQDFNGDYVATCSAGQLERSARHSERAEAEAKAARLLAQERADRARRIDAFKCPQCELRCVDVEDHLSWCPRRDVIDISEIS